VQEWYANLRQKIIIPLPADPTSTLVDAFKNVATFLAGRAGTILQNVASFVFQLFVMLFGLFYFLRDGERIVGIIRQLLPFEPERRDRMIMQTHDLVVATVGSTFAVAIAQGALTGLTLGFLGFQSPVLWGVMTAFTSLLPAVGSGLVWGPAAIYLFATGDIVRGVILVAVGVGVIGMADNVLRPLLLSGRTTMHGLLVFISLLGGMAAFGFIGLVIGPVAIAAIGTLLDAVLEEQSPHGPEPDAP
jgi:predicted PurR-regulated permease PerM